MRRLLPFIAAAVVLVALPHAAAAGQYRVHACTAAGKAWDNRSWGLAAAPAPAGIGVDAACPGADYMRLAVAANKTTPNNTVASLQFTAAPGTRIADFGLTRRLVFNNPAVDGHHRYYALYVLGATVFAGAGDHSASGTVKPWYGNPSDTKLGAVTKASFPALSGYKGDATTLSLRIGCFNRGTPCATGGGSISHELHSASVVIDDPVAPALTVEASGLFSGGQRSGADPITLDATDNSGIRRVELVDVTGGAPGVVVGAEEYDFDRTGAVTTDKQGTCSWRLAVPCPQLTAERFAASSLDAGRRRLIVRAYDAGGLAVDRGPFEVDVVTPSDRGAPNGANATDTATLTATRSARARVVDYGTRVRITGRLTNANGAPIGGARIDVLRRDLGRTATIADGAVLTSPDGTFTALVRVTASRQYQLAWRSRERDVRFAATGYGTVRARASASLTAPARARLGRTIRLTGTLRGVRAAGIPLVAVGRPASGGRYSTIRLGRTRAGGRFTLTYRFTRPSSRGRTFLLRVRILPRRGFPYEAGATRAVRVRVR